MYRVRDLILSDDDFLSLCYYSKLYESGEVTLTEFKKFAKELMSKYGKKADDIWRYEYACITSDYEKIFRLIRAILRFRRPIRTPGDWKHYDYHWIQVVVFTISDKFDREDVEKVARQIVDDLPENWNRLGGGVTFVPEYSIYNPPEVLTKDDGFTEEKYESLKAYLEQYDPVSRNPDNWENFRPPNDFKNADHILSHYIACGIEEDKKIEPEWDLLDLLMVECPCMEPEDFPVSESLTVYAGTDISQHCTIWKKSGWRVRGAKYIPPASGVPPTPKKPGRPKKTESASSTGKVKEEKVPNKWPNPLRDYDVYRDFHPKFWDTLKVCQKFGLNPIPLQPNSKIPAIEWKYLTREPIKPEHLEFFKRGKYNIGIVAGYHNLMIVDIDVKLPLKIDTMIDSTPRGYHYYFFVDRVVPGVAFKIRDGLCKGKSPLGIKGYGYVVAPNSVFNGKVYKWVKNDKIMRVKSDALIKTFTEFFEKHYNLIRRLFEKQC